MTPADLIGIARRLQASGLATEPAVQEAIEGLERAAEENAKWMRRYGDLRDAVRLALPDYERHTEKLRAMVKP